MNLHWLLAVFLGCLACSRAPAPPPTAASQPAHLAVDDEETAVRALIDYVRTEKVYPEGADCLTFEVEDTATDHYDIAVREKHGGGCPSDPAMAPVRDRFRVPRTGEILRYEVVDDNYVTVRPAR